MPTAFLEIDTFAQWTTSSSPPVILDARARLDDHAAGAALWREAHVPGARHADLEGDLASAPTHEGGRHPLPDKHKFAIRLREWGITPERPVVVYDDTGGRLAAARAWWLLLWAGHPQVYVLDGGWPAWQAADLAVETGPGAVPEPSACQPAFDDSMIAPVTEVAHAETVLMDARAPERFRGETEPLDSRAGHIPGATNVPGTDLLDAGQRFRAASDLAAMLPSEEGAIAYCGSGVSACQLILASAQLGRPLPRLYPGSWSAWSADPARPVATGSAVD